MYLPPFFFFPNNSIINNWIIISTPLLIIIKKLFQQLVIIAFELKHLLSLISPLPRTRTRPEMGGATRQVILSGKIKDRQMASHGVRRPIVGSRRLLCGVERPEPHSGALAGGVSYLRRVFPPRPLPNAAVLNLSAIFSFHINFENMWTKV